MNSKQKTVLGVFVVVVLLIGAAAFFGATPGTIASSSKISFDTGKSAYLFNYGLTAGDNVALTLTPQGGTTASGQTITPDGSTLSVLFSPGTPTCEVGLTQILALPALSYYDNAGAYRTLPQINFYGVSAPRSSLPYFVQVSHRGVSKSATVDALQTGGVPALSWTDSDGKGTVTVTNLGGFTGAYSCQNVGDVAISTKSGTVGAVGLSDLNAKIAAVRSACGNNYEYVPNYPHPFIVSSCVSALDNLAFSSFAFPNGFYGGFVNLRYNPNDFSKVVWNLPPSSGTAAVVVTADGEYFNSAYTVPPTVGTPEVSATVSNAATCALSNEQRTVSVTYKNKGTATGQISVSSSTSAGTLSPAFLTGNLAPGESRTETVTLSTPGVSSVTNAQINFVACAGSQFNTGSCSTASVGYCTQPRATPTPVGPTPTPGATPTPCPSNDPYCGNNGGSGFSLDDLRLSRLICGAPKPGQIDLFLVKFETPDLANSACVGIVRYLFPFVLAILLVLAIIPFRFANPVIVLISSALIGMVFFVLWNLFDLIWWGVLLVTLAFFLFANGKKRSR